MKCPLFARLAIAVALMAPYTSAFSQELKVVDVLSGTQIPLVLKPGDLSADYRPVKISTGAMSMDSVFGMSYSSMMGSSGGDQTTALMKFIDVSWTKGDLVSLEGHQFLVTYKLDTSISELAMRSFGAQNRPGKRLSDLVLKLCLVRVDNLQTLEAEPGISRDELVKIIKNAPKPADYSMKSQGLSNIKQVATGMIMYASDSDDILPYPQGQDTVRAVTEPYLKSREVWKSNNPNKSELRFNLALGGVNLAKIEHPAETVMFYETKPWPDGTRLVAFADGHATSVDSRKWQTLEKWLKRRIKAEAKPLPMHYNMESIFGK